MVYLLVNIYIELRVYYNMSTQIQKSPKASLIPISEGFNMSGLKMVKNASIFQERGIYFIRHYETIIFAHNPGTKLTEVNWHCSITSDRQIRSAIEFFNVEKSDIVDVSDGAKWNYSGPFN